MRALICGIAGQDGAYLAKRLLDHGYEVIGSSRDAATSTFSALRQLGILGNIKTISVSLNDFRSVLGAIQQFQPDELYNLAGQTSVGLSFDQPVETLESITSATLTILEAIRFSKRNVRFYNAGSSEIFGDTPAEPANELSPLLPRSPYGVAKASAYWLVRNYREAYGIFACTGILSNHESPLRPERFVTQKIVYAAARISNGSTENLELGNVDIQRDWGWAPEYVQAMHMILQQSIADDFVISTGRTVSLQHFIEQVFGYFSLDWQNHVRITQSLYRPSDIRVSRVSAKKANERLGWKAKYGVEDTIKQLCAAAILRPNQ